LYNESVNSAEPIKVFKSGELPVSNSCCNPISVHVDTEAIAAQVKLLAALADNTRLAIVQLLASQDEPVCVCDITSQFDLGQPTISHHLRILREAGLVQGDKRGLWVYYSLNRDALAPVAAQVESLIGGARVLQAAGR
jgi:ArsR family transcriptional regulator